MHTIRPQLNAKLCIRASPGTAYAGTGADTAVAD